MYKIKKCKITIPKTENTKYNVIIQITNTILKGTKNNRNLIKQNTNTKKTNRNYTYIYKVKIK